MYGPTLLLQQWSWSRLPISRPIPNEPEPAWGTPDPHRCPAYGKKWYGTHRYRDSAHGGSLGIRPVRLELQCLVPERVEWTPYDALIKENRLSQITLDQWFYGLYRGPLVCFWIMEHHYPDRVLRQFGQMPLIPTDPALSRSAIRALHQ